MRDSAVIRQVAGGLCWYPPGSSEAPRSLADPEEILRLQALAAARRGNLIFAVPGGDIRLQSMSFTAAEKRHIGKSLPFLLEDEFASDIENLHFASLPLGKFKLAVAICARACMDEWGQLLKELPTLPLWTPECLLLPWQAGEMIVVVESDMVVVRCDECAGFSVESTLANPMIAAAIDETIESIIVYGEEQVKDTQLFPADLQSKVQWRKGGFAAALMLSEESKVLLDIRQGEYGPSLPLDRWWRHWRLAAGLFAVAFVLQLASTYLLFTRLESENLVLRQERERVFREAVPRGVMQDPEKQLRLKLAGLSGGAGDTSFVSLMERIGRAIEAEKGAQLSTVNFSSRSGDVRLGVVAPDFGAVETIRGRLIEAGLSAETENSNTQGDAVRARLKVSEG